MSKDEERIDKLEREVEELKRLLCPVSAGDILSFNNTRYLVTQVNEDGVGAIQIKGNPHFFTVEQAKRQRTGEQVVIVKGGMCE